MSMKNIQHSSPFNFYFYIIQVDYAHKSTNSFLRCSHSSSLFSRHVNRNSVILDSII